MNSNAKQTIVFVMNCDKNVRANDLIGRTNDLELKHRLLDDLKITKAIQ